MRSQRWILHGLSLVACAACGDGGSSGNDLGTNIGNATGTGTDAQSPALKSDAAASAEAEEACVQFVSLLCGKVTDCAVTNGTLSDQDQPTSLSSCQSDTEASLGCARAKYVSPGFSSCEDAISASACADALSVSNLPEQCSGVIVAP